MRLDFRVGIVNAGIILRRPYKVIQQFKTISHHYPVVSVDEAEDPQSECDSADNPDEYRQGIFCFEQSELARPPVLDVVLLRLKSP